MHLWLHRTSISDKPVLKSPCCVALLASVPRVHINEFIHVPEPEVSQKKKFEKIWMTQ